MRSFLGILLILIELLPMGCSDIFPLPEEELPISGKWLYEDNIEAGCDSLVGSIFEIKGMNAIILSSPPNSSDYKVGDKIFSDIKINKNNNADISAIGYSRNQFGWIKDKSIMVKIFFSGSGQEMAVIYSGTDCNAKQHWVKIP